MHAGSAQRWSERVLSQAERLTLLAELSGTLAASLDFTTAVEQVVAMLVPRFARACVVHRYPTPAADALVTVALWPRDPSAAAHITTLFSNGPADQVTTAQWANVFGSRPISPVTLPLAARGRTLGDMTYVFDGWPPVQEWRTDLAYDIATRVALALHNDQLYADAQEAVRTREEILATVAHDLKNPLTVLSGTIASMLASAGGEPSVLVQRPHLDRLARATQAIERLIAALLDDVSIRAGQLTLNRRAVRVADLFAEAAELLSPLALQQSILLTIRAAEPELVVNCDRDRMLQVFSNLVGNALKYTPRGGAVTLEAALQGGEVEFRVQDTGPGIAPRHLPYLFDRYRRPMRGERSGTGLGLSIVHGIVVAHGGSIRAESQVGSGTTILFTLPS